MPWLQPRACSHANVLTDDAHPSLLLTNVLTDDAHPSLLLFFDAFFDHAFVFLFLSMHLSGALPTQEEMTTQCKMTTQERMTTQYETDV